MDEISPSQFKSLYVDDNHKIIYCKVPKVACTNWLRIFIVLSGTTNISNPLDISPSKTHHEFERNLHQLSDYSIDDIRHKLQNYFKFIFVREPFERILSAYRNKFTTSYNKYFQQRYGKHIIREYRKNPTTKALNTGSDVKFHEFVAYLLDPKTKRPFNDHWNQYYRLCHPCLVQYDVIGKYESLEEDAEYVFERTDINKILHFPKSNRLAGKPRTSDVYMNSFQNISRLELHKLWELYKVDFSMFGYPYPDII